MSDTLDISRYVKPLYLNMQSCVIAVRKANLPVTLKIETEHFIERNIIPDCGRVAPNCLKAFMIKTAQKMRLNRIIPKVKALFRSKVGYDGYFLDAGKLCHVDFRNN